MQFTKPEGSVPCFKKPSLVPKPSRTETVHALIYRFFKIHFHILKSTPSSSEWFLSFSFFLPKPWNHFSSPIHATCPDHLIFLKFITRTILGEKQIMQITVNKLSVLQLCVSNYIFILQTTKKKQILFSHEGNFYIDTLLAVKGLLIHTFRIKILMNWRL